MTTKYIKSVPVLGSETEKFHIIQTSEVIIQTVKEVLDAQELPEWLDRTDFKFLKELPEPAGSVLMESIGQLKEIQSILLKGHAFCAFGSTHWEGVDGVIGFHMIHRVDGIGGHYIILTPDEESVSVIELRVNT